MLVVSSEVLQGHASPWGEEEDDEEGKVFGKCVAWGGKREWLDGGWRTAEDSKEPGSYAGSGVLGWKDEPTWSRDLYQGLIA